MNADYWTSLATTLERFSVMFLADIPGVYGVYGDGIDATARGGVQYPLLEPLVAVPAMAAVTERLGFGVTASVTYKSPSLLPRTLSTLDHFTGDRVAWNLVTSYQDSAARNLGYDKQLPHGVRYDRATSTCRSCESFSRARSSRMRWAPTGSRASGSTATASTRSGTRASGSPCPSTRSRIRSPQGTLYLFRAGAGSRGQAFSLDHAEAIFFSGSTPQVVPRWVDGVQQGLEERGRAADAVRMLTMVTVIVADTDEEAQAPLEEYRPHGALALFGGWTGGDPSGLNPDATLKHVQSEANHSALASFTTLSSRRTWSTAR